MKAEIAALLIRAGIGAAREVSVDGAVKVAPEYAVLLNAHPMFKGLTDTELLKAVRSVPGMVSKNTGVLVLPVYANGKVNRAMAIAVLMRTDQLLG